MATNILMPALSPTMTEGTLARWLKHEGERVTAGDVIAEIETDKATMEVEAVDEGVLGRILVPDGTQGVKVNAPIAVLVADGEAVPAGARGTRGAALRRAGAPAPRRPPPRRPPCRGEAERRTRLRRQRARAASSPRRWRAGWRSRRESISPP